MISSYKFQSEVFHASVFVWLPFLFIGKDFVILTHFHSNSAVVFGGTGLLSRNLCEIICFYSYLFLWLWFSQWFLWKGTQFSIKSNQINHDPLCWWFGFIIIANSFFFFSNSIGMLCSAVMELRAHCRLHVLYSLVSNAKLRIDDETNVCVLNTDE